MEMEPVKHFNGELVSLYENKLPVSKAKMVLITKAAIKAIKYYKHVVMSVEKFIQKCRPEYKVPGLYVIDSIVRQSRHQFGPGKDVFGPRFAKNILNTFQNLFKCPEDDKTSVIRVLHLWLKNSVFPEDVLRPIVSLADDMGFDIGDLSNGKGAQNIDASTSDQKMSPVKEPKSPECKDVQELDECDSLPREHGDIDPEVIQQIQKLTHTLISQQQSKSAEHERKLSKKILADYEYSDDSGDEYSDKMASPDGAPPDLSANLAAAAQNLLNNPELLQQIQEMQQSMRSPSYQSKHLASTASGVAAFDGGNAPPPVTYPAAYPMSQVTDDSSPLAVSTEVQKRLKVMREADFSEQPRDDNAERYFDDDRDMDERRRLSPQHADSRRQRSRERDRDKRFTKRSRSRSRSPSKSRSRRHGRSRSDERHKDRDMRDKERDRKKQALPLIKSGHASVCSCTLWFGRIPAYCEPEEIKESLKDYGEPISIDLIPPRGCAYVVMPDRRSAFRVLDRLRDMRIQNRLIKMAWAPGKGVKEDYKDMWDADNGVTYIPWDKLPSEFGPLLDGGIIDADSLPPYLMDKYKEALEKNIREEATAVPSAPPVLPAPAFTAFPPMASVFSNVPPPGSMFGSVPPPGLLGVPLPGAAPPRLPSSTMAPTNPSVAAVTQLAPDSSSIPPPYGGMRHPGINYLNPVGGPQAQSALPAMSQFPPILPRSGFPHPPMMQPQSATMGAGGRSVWSSDSANSVSSEHSFPPDAGSSARFVRPPLLGPGFPVGHSEVMAGPGVHGAGFSRFPPPVNLCRFPPPDLHDMPPDRYRGPTLSRDEESEREIESFPPERRQRRSRWSSSSKDRGVESKVDGRFSNDDGTNAPSTLPEGRSERERLDEVRLNDCPPSELFPR